MSEPQIAADRSGVIRRWDEELVAVFGYEAHEAVGQKVDLIVPRELRARHWHGFERAMTAGQLKRPGKALRVPAIHKSGAVVPVRGIIALDKSEDETVDGVTLTVSGQGPPWAGTVWRGVLAVLRGGGAVAGRFARRGAA